MTDVLIHNFGQIMKARERIVLCMFGAVLSLVVAYVFLMERTVANTVALNDSQAAITRESQTVSALSARYLAVSGNITLTAALAEGFSEADPSAYIAVPAESPALSFNAL
jgi:type II secretory pathway component PulM